MTILEALGLCRSGWKVRPVCWRTLNRGHWVETVPWPHHDPNYLFVEHGTLEEIPHALRLALPPELEGPWEVIELDGERRVREVLPGEGPP